MWTMGSPFDAPLPRFQQAAAHLSSNIGPNAKKPPLSAYSHLLFTHVSTLSTQQETAQAFQSVLLTSRACVNGANTSASCTAFRSFASFLNTLFVGHAQVRACPLMAKSRFRRGQNP